jgi:SET domain-containing protein
MDIVILKKPLVEVRQSAVHGYGVFAARDITEGELIEECPVIIVPHANLDFINYWFRWQKSEDDVRKSALALGYGSLYNHSQTPNAVFQPDYERQALIIKANKKIAKGEEIFIFYANDWFAVRGMREKKPRSKTHDYLVLMGKIAVIIAIIVFLKLIIK